MIPLCDVKQQYLALQDEIDAALSEAAQAGQYILGPNVKAFEREAAAYCGAEHAVGVANGTDALHLALRGLGIGPGDEVITTPFTFIATAEAISLVGATPVFVDIDPQTFNIDPAQIQPAITPHTRAILPVHLYGQPCDMDPIMELAARYRLSVVEDCAQAMGATYKGKQVGTFGDAGCFSFFPSKNLGALGDAGMIVTNDRSLFERVEMLRRHGGRVKYHHEAVGVNSRLDELQAAILRVKLPHLDEWNDLRRRHAARYHDLLDSMPGLTCPQELAPAGTVQPPGIWDKDNGLLRAVYHQYTLLTDDRDGIVEWLKQEGVGSLVYYPVPLHLQQVYASLGCPRGSFPQAEAVAERCFSIPMFPEFTLEQQDRVIASLTRFAETQAGRSHRRAA